MEIRPRPAPVRADILNPNPSYVPEGHKRPADALVNGVGPTLPPLKGLRTEDFDRAMTIQTASPELHGYDPKRFLRIREFFLRVALKTPEELAEKRKGAEKLTAEVWNEAAQGSRSNSPNQLDGAVHQSQWYRENGSPDLKLMRNTRARRVVRGFKGYGGVARHQNKAKLIANAEQQPVARAVKRARLNGDTSRNARDNEAFLAETTHHVHHANHAIIDKVKGTEKVINPILHPVKTIKHPVQALESYGAPIRNRGKIGNQIKRERKNAERTEKIDRLVKAQVAKMTPFEYPEDIDASRTPEPPVAPVERTAPVERVEPPTEPVAANSTRSEARRPEPTPEAPVAREIEIGSRVEVVLDDGSVAEGWKVVKKGSVRDAAGELRPGYRVEAPDGTVRTFFEERLRRAMTSED